MIKEVPRPARQSPERAFSCALLFYGHAGSAVQECPSVERSVGNDAENVGGDAITAGCVAADRPLINAGLCGGYAMRIWLFR